MQENSLTDNQWITLICAIINSTAFDYLSTFVKYLLDFIEAH